MDPAESTASARGFIRALYDDNDLVAVLAVGRAEAKRVHQRIAPARNVAADRFQRWLRHLNAQGHDVYLGMNPIRTGTKGRHKGDVAEVRRLQVDLDEAGPESLRKILADASADRLPQPAIVLRSSEGRYQVLWHTTPGWTPAQAEDTMARLAQHYGGDHVTDISRVMRLPGFRNKKEDRGDAPVHWTDYQGPPVDRAAFQHLPTVRREAAAPPARRNRPRGPAPLSQSERDWASVKDELRKGTDPAQLVAELARQRQDKPDPQYYAERTVRRASDSLVRDEPSLRHPGPSGRHTASESRPRSDDRSGPPR